MAFKMTGWSAFKQKTNPPERKPEDKKSLSNISANNRKEIHKIDEEIEFLNEDVSSGVKTQQQIQAELNLLKSEREKLMKIK